MHNLWVESVCPLTVCIFRDIILIQFMFRFSTCNNNTKLLFLRTVFQILEFYCSDRENTTWRLPFGRFHSIVYRKFELGKISYLRFILQSTHVSSMTWIPFPFPPLCVKRMFCRYTTYRFQQALILMYELNTTVVGS